MNNKGDEYKHCFKCAQKIFKEAEICPKCGIRQAQLRGKKNKFVAAALAIFFGIFGAHKFYLRKTTQGMFYIGLMIFTLGIAPFFIGIFEGLSYLLMSKEEFDGRYNRLEFLVS